MVPDAFECYRQISVHIGSSIHNNQQWTQGSQVGGWLIKSSKYVQWAITHLYRERKFWNIRHHGWPSRHSAKGVKPVIKDKVCRTPLTLVPALAKSIETESRLGVDGTDRSYFMSMCFSWGRWQILEWMIMVMIQPYEHTQCCCNGHFKMTTVNTWCCP